MKKEENFKIRKRRTKSTEITVNQLMEALPNTQPEEFIKQFFPITYDTFYRTEKEKRVQSSVLDKIRINRSR